MSQQAFWKKGLELETKAKQNNNVEQFKLAKRYFELALKHEPNVKIQQLLRQKIESLAQTLEGHGVPSLAAPAVQHVEVEANKNKPAAQFEKRSVLAEPLPVSSSQLNSNANILAGRKIVQKAVDADRAKQSEICLTLYLEAIDLLQTGLKELSNANDKKVVEKALHQYMARAEEIHKQQQALDKQLKAEIEAAPPSTTRPSNQFSNSDIEDAVKFAEEIAKHSQSPSEQRSVQAETSEALEAMTLDANDEEELQQLEQELEELEKQM